MGSADDGTFARWFPVQRPHLILASTRWLQHRSRAPLIGLRKLNTFARSSLHVGFPFGLGHNKVASTLISTIFILAPIDLKRPARRGRLFLHILDDHTKRGHRSYQPPRAVLDRNVESVSVGVKTTCGTADSHGRSGLVAPVHGDAEGEERRKEEVLPPFRHGLHCGECMCSMLSHHSVTMERWNNGKMGIRFWKAQAAST